jgi:hypothetical protein
MRTKKKQLTTNQLFEPWITINNGICGDDT